MKSNSKILLLGFILLISSTSAATTVALGADCDGTLTVCAATQFCDVDSTAKCVACDETCVNCVDLATTCTSCLTTQYLKTSDDTCVDCDLT